MSKSRQQQIFKDENPFYFYYQDPKMDKNQATNYTTPAKRLQMKSYLVKSSVRFQQQDYSKTDRANISEPGSLQKVNQVDQKLLINSLKQNQQIIQNKMNIALSKDKFQDSSEIKMGYNQDYKQPVDLRTTRHFYHDQDFYQLTNSQSKNDRTFGQIGNSNLSQRISTIPNNMQSLGAQQYSDAKFRKSQNLPLKINGNSGNLNALSITGSLRSKDGRPYPVHVERRNMRNDSSLSLKQESNLYKQEELQKQKLIKWAQQKNKIYIMSQKSYIKYPEVPNPPKVKDVRQSVQLKSYKLNNIQNNRQIDLAQIRAQAIINKEQQYKHIATDFQRARSIIKHKNIRDIDNKMLKSIQSSHYNQNMIGGEYMKSRDDLRQSMSNYESKSLMKNTGINSQQLDKVKAQQKGKRTTFKIGDYSLKMGTNAQLKFDKSRYRTTFQEQYIERKLQNANEQMNSRASSAQQTRNVSVPLFRSGNSFRETLSSRNQNDIQYLNQSFTSVKSENQATKQQYSRPGRITIDKMIQYDKSQKAEQQFQSIYSNKHNNGENGSKMNAKTLQNFNDNNSINQTMKKDIVESHFQLGGKTLISADLNSPMRLLDSEKRLTQFKEKPLSNEQNLMRSKFKEKIERQNWSIKQPLDCSQDFNRENSFHKMNYSLSDYDLKKELRPSSNIAKGSFMRTASHFNFDYKLQNDRKLKNEQQHYSSQGFLTQRAENQKPNEQNLRDSFSQLKQNHQSNMNNMNRKSNVQLGDNKKVSYQSNYKDQYPWQVPKYDL
eukprot:403357366